MEKTVDRDPHRCARATRTPPAAIAVALAGARSGTELASSLNRKGARDADLAAPARAVTRPALTPFEHSLVFVLTRRLAGMWRHRACLSPESYLEIVHGDRGGRDDDVGF
jgi:hypothetical protein